MFKRVLLILLLIIIIVFNFCSTTKDRPQIKEDYIMIAKNFIELLDNGNYKEAVSYFDQTMKFAMSENELKKLWEITLTETYGEFEQIYNTKIEEVKQKGTLYKVVFITCKVKNPNEDSNQYYILRVVLNDYGEVAGLWHEPANKDIGSPDYKLPEYSDENKYTREIHKIPVKNENNKIICELDAVLTIPISQQNNNTKDKDDGQEAPKYPAVILVHGSGANDKDETIGANKPFKDIATALSSNGIAVLRYNKRTYQCPEAIADKIESFTLYDETIEDCLSAVELLKTHKHIDSRLYIVGHSLGGMVSPRIASQTEDIAGIVMLAGNARNLLELILEQTEYIFELDGEMSEEETLQIQELQDKIAKIKSGDFSENETILGAGKGYWEDILDYDPVMTAKSIDIPMLILQGERDYQVTIRDFELWKKGLEDKDNVVFKTYKDLNHLFMPGTGKSTPQEYNNPSHVAFEVIKDIINFIRDDP